MEKIILLFFLVFLIKPNVVSAVEMTPKTATRAAVLSVSLKAKAYAEIDRRINVLTKLINQIGILRRLDANQKSNLIAQVQTEVNNLTQLKAKIEGDTDLATLKADKKSISDSYQGFSLLIPRIHLLIVSDQILIAVERFEAVPRIASDSAMIVKLADAKKQTLNVQAMTIVDKTFLTDARSKIKIAQSDLKIVYAKIKEIKTNRGS